MVIDDPRDLPAYRLADLPRSTTHCVVTPGWRWRVIVQASTAVGADLLLRTVVRLRQAGVTSTLRISDLLQLSYDLVEHLNGLAARKGLYIDAEREVQAPDTRVAWIYRDLRTDELWPEPAPEQPPVSLQFVSTRRAWFEQGSAGAPVRVHAVLLPADLTEPATPTPAELIRFSKASSDPGRRTAVVGQGEPCLVVSPLTHLGETPIVATTIGVPHEALTRALAEAGGESREVANWLAAVTPADADHDGPAAPLRASIRSLARAVSMWNEYRQEDLAGRVKGCVEQVLRRYCDQAWYAAGVDPSGTAPPSQDPGILARALDLTEAGAATLATAVPGTLPATVLRLVLETFRRRSLTGVDARGLARLTCEWAELSSAAGQQERLARLARQAIDLCEALLMVTEDADGREAE
jgi:hypothetical protein